MAAVIMWCSIQYSKGAQHWTDGYTTHFVYIRHHHQPLEEAYPLTHPKLL
ncbi:MAG: hypothetical protein ABSA11_12650 [Candidatus Bathyarchaeia archaeon]